MTRAVRDHRLETRAARLRLPIRQEPYWRQIRAGCHLGYYRGSRGGKWVARHRTAGSVGGYQKVTLAEADDFNESDGLKVLDYAEAQEAARTWFRSMSGNEFSGSAGYTVSHCLDDYLDAFTGKSIAQTR